LKTQNYPSPQGIVRGQRGQIVVEYVLLLVTGLTVAIIITSAMVSRSDSSPGFLISKWLAIISLVGQDMADE
jgi:hypothetical protein